MSTAANPVTSANPATPQPGQILMVAPSGEAAYVPQDQVADYQSKGGQLGVRMTAPDGKEKAIVPFNQQDAYQKQGATWDVTPDNDAVKAFVTQRSVAQSRSQTPGKAMVPVMGEPRMMMVDVPQGQEASAEQASDKGQAIAGGVGVGMLATAGLAGLAVPGVITEEAASGLVDEFGGPITREIIKQGPSVLGKAFQATTEWATSHPITAKVIIDGAGITGGLAILNKMRKLAGEFGGK